MNQHSPISRRTLLKAALLTVGGSTVASHLPQAAAQQSRKILGTVIDYAGAVPSAQAIHAAGHLGSIRYVSVARPGAEWMKAKPLTLQETTAQAAAGLQVASVYQFGKAETADWKQGGAGVLVHAPQAIQLHKQAGGPSAVPIYVAIDDNPTREEYLNQIKPYLQGFGLALQATGLKLGIYGNYNTVEWAHQDGLGDYYWQHDWGSKGQLHAKAAVHQKAGQQSTIDGVTVDINNVYAKDWGQWTPVKADVVPLGEVLHVPTSDDLTALLTKANLL